MPEVSDVDLMQYADGTLAPSEHRVIEDQVARDAELQQRLRPFLATGKELARLFEPVTSEPVPERLIAAIFQRGASTAPTTLHRGPAPSLWQRVTDGLADIVGGSPRLAFASVAALAVAAGWWLGGPPMHPGPSAPVAPAKIGLARALETTPSYKTVRFARDDGATAVFKAAYSFRHKDGRFCRQYEVELKANEGTLGIACRTADGGWHVENDIAAPVNLTDDNLRAAGALDEQRREASNLIETAVGQMAVGDVLLKDQEAELIRGGWRPNN